MLTWKYTGGGCGASDNDQPLDKAYLHRLGVSGDVTMTD